MSLGHDGLLSLRGLIDGLPEAGMHCIVFLLKC